MSVYVDAPIWPYRGMMMCHMSADTLEELHEMADKLGLKRTWFQTKSIMPHYDIAKGKRAQAVRLGAIEIDLHKSYALVNEWRARGWLPQKPRKPD